MRIETHRKVLIMKTKRKLFIIICLCIIIVGVYIHVLNRENEMSNFSQEHNVNEFGYQILESIPDDYTIEKAVMDGAVNLSFGGIDNKDKIIEFFNNVYNNNESMIRIIQYTTEGEPIYSDIVFHSGNHQDQFFEYKEKNNPVELYDFLITYEGEIYLSNETEYNLYSDTQPICFTARGIDENIWDDSLPVIEKIMKKSNKVMSK